jgi:nicotinamide-nucleotide amidase
MPHDSEITMFARTVRLFSAATLLSVGIGHPAEEVTLRFVVVVTGDELLKGSVADAHAHFLIRTLGPLGLDCVGSMIVGDNPADLRDAMRFAVQKAPLVIVTGGLGPTENDITRQALAEFTGIPLREHPEVVGQMEKRFGQEFSRLRANLRRQAQVPARGTYLKNPNGTAVGLVFEMDNNIVVALPGPPRELQAMVREELIRYLSQRFKTRSHVSSLTIRFVGIGQSAIDEALRDNNLMARDILVSSQFESGRVDFTFSLASDKPEDHSRLEALKGGILKYLGEYVYATDGTSLEEAVAQLLKTRGLSIALVEIGSGGSLAAGLNGAATAGSVVAGAFAAPTAEVMARLLRVSPAPEPSSALERAREFAARAAELTSAQWVVSVGEVDRSAGTGAGVQVMYRLPGGRLETQRVALRGSADQAHFTLTTQVLDYMRRLLR